MSPSEREDVIVKEAVRFFAEFGFEGHTRELARRLDITQPLLYRYFATKDALVERVYQEVFLRRWNPFWDEVIGDRSKPLRERMVAFYQDYAKAILTYEWIRLFMFSGLKGLDFNTRYLELLRRRVFNTLVDELRLEFGAPGTAEKPPTDIEVEAVWSLHAAIFYLGVRKFIYNMPVGPLEPIIEMKVLSFVDGVGVVVRDATTTAG
ncbi:TetR family transcriptional regulator [Chelatococcus asaccharovorans]|uniref:TetR family transcriptional regulator n=2 Tax=Chelatococcus asaccharovorans TaxID=28210 RepID=A0A2V3UKA2_9HYPH|nr:TetR/AcrR family transcriptional regulator [Chelatococcus asaccharovorans]MBS7706626.1 TetR/AcrR family transcriptional regulator [Chelatococcus asaccharovorans]PXW64724.1 TetR family transcriptional regulator [Chelatococcus asaccharovorans]